MGLIVAIGSAICSGIAAAAAAVASVVVTICSAIYTAVAWIAGATVGLFSGIAAGALNGLGILSGDLAISIGTSLGSISAVSGSMYFTAGAWIEALGAWFSTFLTVIHFDTLKQINDIAYIVSADYREYMNKVYGKIGEFSKAIAQDSYFAIQLIENARSVVLDTSSMLVRPYDIGELTWLEEFEGFLKAIEKKSSKYKDNPYELINDINELLLKPSIDLKAQEMQGILSTIDQVIEIVDGTVNDVIVIKEDVEKLVHELPQSLREKLEPAVNHALDVVNDFIDRQYYPEIGKLKQSMRIVLENESVQEDKMKSIVDRLKRPDQYIKEIEQLPEAEQLQAYEMFADYSSKIYRQPVTAWRQYAEPYSEEFLKIGELITKPRALPEWEVPEVSPPSTGPIVKSGGGDSPFPEDV